jgi:pyruvate/2-oxoglutarate/acetoin dehydrogenase E1 component
MRFVDSLRDGLHTILSQSPEHLILGEDILDPYGGAFKVTRGLTSKYESQLIQTPVSEAGFIGVATGLAYIGFKPIVEVMFGDFLTLTADGLINGAAKFEQLSQGKMQGSVLVRTPVGGGRGYGPIHSQSLEKLLLGWPNIDVVAASTLAPPGEVLQATFARDTAVKLFIENKLDYPKTLLEDDSLQEMGFRKTRPAMPLPTCTVSNCDEGTHADVTVACYGGTIHHALDAAYEVMIEDEVSCDVVVPSLVYPLDADPIVASVRRTGGLVTVEEGHADAGWGSYVLRCLSSRALPLPLDRTRVVGPKNNLIPAQIDREQEHLPSSRTIAAAIRELL